MKSQALTYNKVSPSTTDSDEETGSSSASDEESHRLAPGCCDKVRACRVRCGLSCFGLVEDPLAALQIVGIDCSRFYGVWSRSCCCIALLVASGIVLFFVFRLQHLLGAGTIVGLLPWFLITFVIGSYFCVLACTTNAGVRAVMTALGRTSSDPERPQRVLEAYGRLDFDEDVEVSGLDANSARTLRLLVKSHDEVIIDALKIGFNTNILEKVKGDDRSQHFLLSASLLGAENPESVNGRLRVIVNDKGGMDVCSLDDERLRNVEHSFTIAKTLRNSGVKWQRALSTVLLPMAESRAVLLRWALGTGTTPPIGMDFHWIKSRVGQTLDAVDEMNVARILLVPPREEMKQTEAAYNAMGGSLVNDVRMKRMKNDFRAGFLALLQGTSESSESLQGKLRAAVAGKQKSQLLELLCSASEDFVQSLPHDDRASILGVFGENLDDESESDNEKVSSTTVPSKGSGPLDSRSLSTSSQSSRPSGRLIQAKPGLFDWITAKCGPQAAEQFEIALDHAEHAVEVAYDAVEEEAQMFMERLKGPSAGHLVRLLLAPPDGKPGKKEKVVDRAWRTKTILSKRYLAEVHYCIHHKDAMGLVGLLMHLDDEQRSRVELEYEKEYGDEDEEDTSTLARSICSGKHTHYHEMEVVLLGMLRPPEWAWARTLWEACCGGLIGLGTDEETLTSVIVLNWDKKTQLKDALLAISKWKGKEYTLQGLIDSEIENANFKIIMNHLLDEDRCSCCC